MWRALSLRLGMPLRWLKQAMTWREFIGWCRYYGRQPFDDMRCYDLPAAQMQALYANAHKKPNAPGFSASDFLPFPMRNDEPNVDDLLLKMFEAEDE